VGPERPTERLEDEPWSAEGKNKTSLGKKERKTYPDAEVCLTTPISSYTAKAAGENKRLAARLKPPPF
jgi:hypothetical protein